MQFSVYETTETVNPCQIRRTKERCVVKFTTVESAVVVYAKIVIRCVVSRFTTHSYEVKAIFNHLTRRHDVSVPHFRFRVLKHEDSSYVAGRSNKTKSSINP